ncbi:protein of unknown function [Burkholderia multivorans]
MWQAAPRAGCPLSAAYRLPATGYRLPPTAYRLSPIAYRLSPIAYRLSPIAYRLSPAVCRLPPVASVLIAGAPPRRTIFFYWGASLGRRHLRAFPGIATDPSRAAPICAELPSRKALRRL